MDNFKVTVFNTKLYINLPWKKILHYVQVGTFKHGAIEHYFPNNIAILTTVQWLGNFRKQPVHSWFNERFCCIRNWNKIVLLGFSVYQVFLQNMVFWTQGIRRSQDVLHPEGIMVVSLLCIYPYNVIKGALSRSGKIFTNK